MKLLGRWAAGILAATVLTMGSVPATLAEPFRLIVTDLEAPLVPNSVMDLAISLGYFEREGVDVQLVRVQQTPSALAALQAGEGEMANIGVDALLQLVAGGATDLKAVVSPNKSLPFLIAAKDSIGTPTDLVGKTFGVGRVGSVDHSLSTRVLGSNGVDTASVNMVALGQPAVRAQALAAGQVDATTISIGVWNSLPDRTGLHVLIDQDHYFAAAPVVNKVNIVTQATLDNRRDDVVAVIRGLIRISRDVAADPKIWVDGMAAARPDVNRAVLETLAQAFARSWSVNGGMNPTELTETSAFLYDSPDFNGVASVELAQWADFGPVDAVLAGLDVAPDLDPTGR